LENEDLASINKYLENIKRDFIHPKLPRTMENYFPEELFYFDKDFESKEKVIDFLCESLREKGYVTEQFRDEVIKRERLSSTAFDNLIAMPHSMKRGALKSAVAVVILKKPITWQGQKVQCVFLLSIKEDERKYLIRFFDIIVERLNDKSKIKKIIENDTYDKFINAIQ
jgi:lichenan operon transcriptional antiterminator